MYRAPKSGISAEMQAKVESKYDPEQAEECLRWIQTLLQQYNDPCADFVVSGDRRNFLEVLSDGLVLGRLSNILMPGCIPESKVSKRPTLPFKKMELIGLFLEKIKDFDIPDHELFATIDLHEAMNLNQVVICLSALGRKARLRGFSGCGPNESQANIRNFSEEQLRAGQNVISLQYGSNKGASQRGMIFGKNRMIID